MTYGEVLLPGKTKEEILEDYDYTFLLVSDETIPRISKFKNEMNFDLNLSLIHISEPTRRYAISYAVFCLKKNKKPMGVKIQ